ncbi:LysR family transcriptional regulator [Shewanella electrodiphila]|uniref:LysR family transcriptional regulator n=1 Tax=Shewanella electrodiphila TaxID=934143 RepID=A0ABT0KMV8_9GAMM|nr:LysR family transcriptional regulator [Shewanella electrodiphila]MCL1045109.1 LysR family transcriptional regulator [Shewanella electrodiphila]
MLRHLANHLPYFSAVAKSLSFSNAANELAVSQPSISYQIKCLEEKLGFQLFIRGQGNKVELTNKGSKLFQEYVILERNFNQVIFDTQVNQSRTKLEMTAPVDLGVQFITPMLSQLENDQLIINLDLTDEVVDIKKSKFDFSIRNNKNERGLEYFSLMAAKNVLVCSEQYALTHQLSTFDDITEQHRLIVRSDVKSNTWEKLFLKHDKLFHQHKNMQVINNSFGIYQAIISNIGIGILPEYFIDQSNNKDLYIFKESLSETPYYLAYQPSYVAKKWASLIKTHIIKNFEYLKSLN